MDQDTLQKKRNIAQKDKEKDNKTAKDKIIKPKFGPRITFPYQKVWTRCVLILAVLFIVWYQTKDGKEIILAKQKDVLMSRSVNAVCSDDYKDDLKKFSGCVPEKCSRIVSDNLVTEAEAGVLLNMAKNILSLAYTTGGTATCDLHTGALTWKHKFVNIYALKKSMMVFTEFDFTILKIVKIKIHNAIANHFGIDSKKLYLAKPFLFSRLTNIPAEVLHEEYWHPHVDRETYESLYYTSVVYLNDYDLDFKGGRFIFIDKNNVNTTIEPRSGRVSIFTSGSENLHMVEPVTTGTRYALTVSFTCDKKFAIDDPAYERLGKKSDRM